MTKIKHNGGNTRLVTITVFLFIAIFVSNPSWAAEEKASEPSTEKAKTAEKSAIPPVKPPVALTKQHNEDLKHYVGNNQVKPLLAGPDDYLTLFKKHTSANNKGVAILLPEWQQGATNPKAINFLRNSLPSQGWNTIAIQPSNKPNNFPSVALSLTEQKEENEATLKEYKQKLSALLNSVMNTAREYPGIVLIIAQGNNGALLTEIYSEEGTQQPNALILLSSYRQSSYELIDSVNERFAHQLTSIEIPVLDLYLKLENSLVLAKAPLRKQMAKQEMKAYYRQRQLNNTISGYYPEQELLNQISGWLKVIGW